MKLLRILLGLLAVTVAMEVILRCTGVAFPYFLRVDRDTGFALRPNAEGWEPGEGGRMYIRISSQGLRDREHDLTKPAGTYRIAVLGNSFTQAAQVPLENTFWSLLPQELASCTGLPPVETINFGVNSYSTAQQLALLRSKIWQFDPDLILLLFVPSTDVRKNSREIERVSDRPYFVLRDGNLTEDNTFRDTSFFHFQNSDVARALHFFINNSRILQVLNHRWKNRSSQQDNMIGNVESSKNDAITTDPAYLPPTTDAWKAAWTVTEAILSALHQDVREKNAEFVLVVGENGNEIDFDDQRRAQLLQEQGLEDYSYPSNRLAALGRKENFPVIPLAPELLEYTRTHRRFLHGFLVSDNGNGHWNSEGHRVVAQTIAAHLCPIARSPQ